MQAEPRTTLPLTWPPLRAEAERLAREVFHSMYVDDDESEYEDMTWDEWLSDKGRERRIRCHARLLADLTRPESRDLWVRWGKNQRPRESHPALSQWLDWMERWEDRADNPATLIRELAAIDPDLAALLETP